MWSLHVISNVNRPSINCKYCTLITASSTNTVNVCSSGYMTMCCIQIFHRAEQSDIPHIDWSIAVAGPPVDIGTYENNGTGSSWRSVIPYGTGRNLRNRRYANRRQSVLSNVTSTFSLIIFSYAMWCYSMLRPVILQIHLHERRCQQ